MRQYSVVVVPCYLYCSVYAITRWNYAPYTELLKTMEGSQDLEHLATSISA